MSIYIFKMLFCGNPVLYRLLILMWTYFVTTHPNWSVWYVVLTGMHPNSVTVLMYFPGGTEIRPNCVNYTRVSHEALHDLVHQYISKSFVADLNQMKSTCLMGSLLYPQELSLRVKSKSVYSTAVLSIGKHVHAVCSLSEVGSNQCFARTRGYLNPGTPVPSHVASQVRNPKSEVLNFEV